MGIPGLTKYEKEVLHIKKRGCIRSLAKKYQKSYKCKPILLIDGSNFLFGINSISIPSPLLGGGEIKTVVNALVQFLLRLRESGICFEIFFDASTPTDRYAITAKRSYKRFNKNNMIFQSLLDGSPVGSVDFNPEGLSFYFKSYLTALGVKYIVSMKEADDEIMDYISKHGCFGVISDDSDFLVCEGIPYVFNVQNLDHIELKADYASRTDLANALQIDQILLPYFATLCGNDVITRKNLRKFHLFLLNSSSKVEFLPEVALFPKLVTWIKSNIDVSNLYSNLPEDLACMLQLPDLAKRFRKSVESYVLKVDTSTSYETEHFTPYTEWNKLHDRCIEMIKLGLMHFKIYEIMFVLKLRKGSSMQIYNNSSYACAPLITKDLSKRLYGFLLSERPPSLGKTIVQEWFFTGANSLTTPRWAQPVLPEKKYDLMVYWHPSCPSIVKWEMFCWIIDPALNPEQVMRLPRPLCVPTLAMYLIMGTRKTLDDDWAILALAVQAALLLTATLTDIRNANCGEQTPICLHFSTVFKILCKDIYIASQACGSPVAAYHHPEVPYFDMRLYNDACLKIKKGVMPRSIMQKANSSQVSDGYQEMMSFLSAHKHIPKKSQQNRYIF